MSIRRSTGRNAAISIGEAVALGSLLLVNFAVLVRVFDPATIGLWLLMNALLSFSRVADFWSRGLSSFVGEARGCGKVEEACNFVHTAVFSSGIGYLVVCLAAVPLLSLFSEAIVGPSSAGEMREILPLIALGFWLMSVAGVYHAGFLGFERPLYKVVQTVGGALVFLALVVILGDSLGSSGLALARVGQGFFMLVVSVAVFSVMTLRRSCRIRIDLKSFRRLYRFGTKMIGLGALQLAIEPVSRMLVLKFGSLADVTVFEMASRLVMQFRSVSLAAGQVFIPAFAKHNDAGGGRQGEMYAAVRRTLATFAVPGTAALIALGPPLEMYWVAARDGRFPTFLTILALGWLSNVIAAPAVFLSLGKRQLRPLYVSHGIMTLGALSAGVLGGLLAGVDGTVAGIGLAVMGSSVYLLLETELALARQGAAPEVRVDGLPWSFALRGALPLLVATGGVMISVAAIPATTSVEHKHLVWGGIIVLTTLATLNRRFRQEVLGMIRVFSKRREEGGNE